MNKQAMWTFTIVLVVGVFYITVVEKDFSHVLEYMSAISLVYIACALMYIAARMKKFTAKKKK